MRIGVNIPNGLHRRLEPLKQYINVSQICRDAIEERIRCYEKALASRSGQDIARSIERAREEERKTRAIVEVDWGMLGCADAKSWLGFTHFKRRKRGNLQVGGIERWGVPACRGWLRTVKNPLTPATGGVAPGRWRPRRWATACRTRPPCVGSWGAVFATRGRPGWSRRRAPAGRAWCGRWRDRTTGVGSPHPGGFAPPER